MEKIMVLNHYLWIVLFLIIGLCVLSIFRRDRKKNKTHVDKVPEVDVVPWSHVNEVVEQERHRIASELHDELGSLLSVIHLDLELVLREASSLTPHGEARLLDIKTNLNRVIKSIRHNIWSLAPQMLDQVTLSFALRELCNKLDSYKGTHMNFEETGTSLSLTQNQKLNLFRIVQELLTNAIKHSSAWNIAVQMYWDAESLKIIVEDDGSGYQRVEYGTQNEGMGATNILKRANLIGATIKKEELTRGLRVIIELTMQDQHPAEQSAFKNDSEIQQQQ